MLLRPHIVVVHCDQMRAFALGCHGHPLGPTPHVDALAAEGARFETAVSNNPVCSPARAALLAGRPARACVGAVGNVGIDPPRPQRTRFPDPTLPERLAEAGYHNELIGKWHTWDHPNRCGFHHSLHPLPAHLHYGQRYFEDEDSEGFLVDELVGAVRAKLAETGLADDTILVFTSDHGDNLGSHGMFNKGALIEESIRVPLIFAAPGRVDPAVHTAQVAQTIDLCPTLLRLAGVEAPAHLEWRDLTAVLEGRRKRLEDDAAFIESPRQGVGIRTPRHMLGIPHGPHRTLAAEPAQLYDLDEDPFQRTNRVADPGQARLRDELARRVRAWDRATPWLRAAGGGG